MISTIFSGWDDIIVLAVPLVVVGAPAALIIGLSIRISRRRRERGE